MVLSWGSGQAAWQAVIAYDACVRLCLRAWSRGCMEAPKFLEDECCLLRDCFGYVVMYFCQTENLTNILLFTNSHVVADIFLITNFHTE